MSHTPHHDAVHRPTPTGTDALHSLLTRIDALEARVLALEAKAHDSHTIGDETLHQIAVVVQQDIARALIPLSGEGAPS